MTERAPLEILEAVAQNASKVMVRYFESIDSARIWRRVREKEGLVVQIYRHQLKSMNGISMDAALRLLNHENCFKPQGVVE